MVQKSMQKLRRRFDVADAEFGLRDADGTVVLDGQRLTSLDKLARGGLSRMRSMGRRHEDVTSLRTRMERLLSGGALVAYVEVSASEDTVALGRLVGAGPDVDGLVVEGKDGVQGVIDMPKPSQVYYAEAGDGYNEESVAVPIVL